MKPVLKLALAATSLLLATTPACNAIGADGQASAASAMGQVDIDQILAGITDGASAQAAKGPLDGAVAQLQQALAGAQGEAEGATASGGGMANQAVAGVMAQFGISAETTAMITDLLAQPAVKEVLGATLTQLQGLIPAM